MSTHPISSEDVLDFAQNRGSSHTWHTVTGKKLNAWVKRGTFCYERSDGKQTHVSINRLDDIVTFFNKYGVEADYGKVREETNVWKGASYIPVILEELIEKSE